MAAPSSSAPVPAARTGRSAPKDSRERAYGRAPGAPLTAEEAAYYQYWRLPELGFRNYWYPVMFSSDLRRKPVARMVCGEKLFLIRHRGKAYALHDRCPHRGVQLCGALRGNAGSSLVCSYHAWTFHLDGRIRAIPLPGGYDGTRLSPESRDCSIATAAPRMSPRRRTVQRGRAASSSCCEGVQTSTPGYSNVLWRLSRQTEKRDRAGELSTSASTDSGSTKPSP